MEDTQQNSSLSSYLTLLIVVIGTFMSILDSSIVNIAVPKMMAVFGVPLDDAKWILTAYTLALGAIIPLTGYLQEVISQKKVYMFALAMFSTGSLLCGFAWSNATMITFRVIQAIGGGMIMPVGMSIIYSAFPKEKIGLALGFWGIASMAAPAIGPTLGGYIIEHMDWRLIFNINVPIGIVGVLLAGFILKDNPVKKAKTFDIIGFLSSTIGIVSILYVLGEGSTIDWSNVKNPMLMTLGCLSLVLFLVNELTHSDPLLELNVFKLFDFSIGQIITCVLTLAMMGGSYVLPLFLQNIRGYSAMQAGMIMLPSALVVGIMMPISGNIFDKIGAKPLVIPGLFILAFSSFQLSAAMNMNSSKGTIILITCIRSIGMGLTMMPINTMSMNAIPPKLVGKASALSNTIRQIAGSVSVTIMTTLIQNRLNYNFAKLAPQINPFNSVSVSMISKLTGLYMTQGLSKGNSKVMALSTLGKLIQGQAYVDAMAYSVAVTAVIMCVPIILSVFIRKRKSAAQEGEINEGQQGKIAALE